jgi:uncharacterized protein (UPF0371 family)
MYLTAVFISADQKKTTKAKPTNKRQLHELQTPVLQAARTVQTPVPQAARTVQTPVPQAARTDILKRYFEADLEEKRNYRKQKIALMEEKLKLDREKWEFKKRYYQTVLALKRKKSDNK